MGVKNVIVALSPYGISPRMSMKIYKIYGEKSLDVIRTNPYLLVDRVVGIGFTMLMR